MSSKLATETAHRLAEVTAALNALERRLDELEDLIEAAWDEAVARLPQHREATELRKDRDPSQGPLP